MGTLDHPAVMAAMDALAEVDQDLTPLAAIVRHEVAAIAIDGSRGRYVVFAHPEENGWTTRGTTFGAPSPSGPRHELTRTCEPLQRLGSRFRPATLDPSGEGWFVVIGRAARDAVSLSITSTLEQSVAPIRAEGLAFALVRSYGSEEPQVDVITRDGRQVDVPLLLT